MKGSLFLIGPRASGKTSLGKLAASCLGWELADTDAWLVADAGRTVAGIVAAEGWEGFRKRERQALLAVSKARTVVATGGGMVCLADNRAFMRASGLVVYLRAEPEVLAARLALEPLAEQRPSLTGADPLHEIRAVLREREALYLETAHRVLDASLPLDRLMEHLLTFLEST